MGVSGDFSKLAQMRERLGRMVGVPDMVAKEVAPQCKSLVEQGFATKKDPYGAAWKPIKQNTIARGTESALVRTGRMRDGIDVLPFGAKLRILLGQFYARFHISTGRRTLPKAGQLPDPWGVVISKAAEAAFQKIAGGGR